MQKVRDKIAEFLRYMAKKVGNYESLEMIGELYVVRNGKPILLGRKMITDNGLRALSFSLFSYDTSNINDGSLDNGISPFANWGKSWRFGVYHSVGEGNNPESPTDSDLQYELGFTEANQLKRVLDLTNGRLILISSAQFVFNFTCYIQEHGIWSAYSSNTYVLFDRTVINPPIHIQVYDDYDSITVPFIYRLTIQR